MLTRRSIILSKSNRRGFTLIELLVVISIIATLMALILPAIQSAREAARRTQCLNNIRNITTAALAYAESHKGRLPASGTYKPMDITGDGAADGIFPAYSWVVDVLPNLDQQAIFERWNKNRPFNDGTSNNLTVSALNIPILTCPNDDTADGEDGGLSYVASCGAGDANIDWVSYTPTSNVDLGHGPAAEAYNWDGATGPFSAANQDHTAALGVFNPRIEISTSFGTNLPAPSNAPDSVNIGRVYDGAGNTIMFSENVLGGQSISSLYSAKTWADPSVRSCGFIIPVGGGDFSSLALISAAPLGSPFINQQKNGSDGMAPFPNSRHMGMAVFSFCDGSARTLDENIDRGVYVRLVTSSAARPRTGMPGYEAPISGNEF